MEKWIVKTWVYSFLITLFLCVIFVPDSYKTDVTVYSYTTTVLTLRRYIFEILRLSLGVSLTITAIVAMVLAIRSFRAKRRNN